MKKYTLYSFLFALIICTSACSDEKDPVEPETTDQTVNEWIYETMEKDYLWNTEIPSTGQVNFNNDPDKFFLSLLSSKDGKEGYVYSTINTKSSSTRSYHGDGLTLGFEYQSYYTNDQRNFLQLKVLYVLPNSPAAGSDLSRGEWVHTINNQYISVNMDLASTLYSGTEVTLGVGDLNGESLRSVRLTAHMVEDHPVFLDTVYYNQGRKIGYLVYNHFTSDPASNGYGDKFDRDLKVAFTKFKTENVNEFVLDLRYNNGGLVSCAQLLASMLAPAEALGETFCQMIYNQDQQNKNSSLDFDRNLSGYNLDLKRLYVITSSRTASASEAVINGLIPFLGDNLILIGEKTEGKNVGSITYTKDEFNWELHPIVCYISNKNPLEEADYSAGITPRYIRTEPNNVLELGDEEEYLLARAISLIEGSADLRNETIERELIPVSSSLDKKANRGMILPAQ